MFYFEHLKTVLSVYNKKVILSYYIKILCTKIFIIENICVTNKLIIIFFSKY